MTRATSLKDRSALAAFILASALSTPSSAQVPAPLSDPGPALVKIEISGQLNLRQSPSLKAPIVGHLSDGTVLRNLGCEGIEDRRWCQVEPVDGTMAGWVDSEFLVEGVKDASGTPDAISIVADEGRRVSLSVTGDVVVISEIAAPGARLDIVLDADAGRFLNVSLGSPSENLSFEIFEPDRELVYASGGALPDFFGELRKPGDHVVRVTNSGLEPGTFELELALE